MNVDLRAVREALADMLATIPELRAVYPIESRTSMADELPFAWLWRGVVEPSQSEFGSQTFDFNWRVRVLVRLDEDGPTQDLIDTLHLRLITAVNLDGFLEANGPGVVDQVFITSIDEPELTTFQEQPALLFEALLTTTITG